jgi:uncharacterized protein YukE
MADGDKQIDYDYTEMNQCFNEKHTTPFAGGKNMDEMQAMLRHARPDLVTGVAEGWAGLSKQLISIQGEFDKEVARIQEHWNGAAAERFAEKAKQVSKSIGDTAKYASHTSIAMTNAGSALGPIKEEVMAMEKPSGFSSAMNSLGDGFTRSDDGLNKDLASGKGAQDALDANHDDLSAGREAQLAMAAKMETLGAAYNSQAMAMGSWRKKPYREDDTDYPGDPGQPPTPVIVPTGVPRSPKGATSGTARGGQVGTVSPSKPVAPPAGITGGAHKPTVAQPQVSTAIDGVSGGRTGAPTVGGVGTVGGGSAGGGAVGGGGGFVGGVPGAAAGAGAARGATAGRPGAGGMAGRAGTGAGAGAGAGAAKGGAARAGGLARQSGGVVGGTPKSGAGAGRGTAGGSGLHRSRGAAGGGAGAVRKGGMVGVPGARTGRPKDQEQREGERPDYLVEDEETWTPQRNVAPRVIEE